MGFELVGRVWDPVGFAAYVRTLDLSWAKGITMHHTAAPSLAQRPQGLKAEHLRNLQSYYQSELGWSRGPHLFIDEDQIWLGFKKRSQPFLTVSDNLGGGSSKDKRRRH